MAVNIKIVMEISRNSKEMLVTQTIMISLLRRLIFLLFYKNGISIIIFEVQCTFDPFLLLQIIL